MTLPRKGSRTITVDGCDYRWVVSADSGFMLLVVERDNGTGQRMEASFGYGDRDGGQDHEVTPAVVGRAIALALQEGWRPNGTGMPFRLADAETRLWPRDANSA